MENTKELGKRIFYLRNMKKMLQKDLAERIGKSASYLCDIEKGRINPSLKVIFKIAEALGTDVQELFYRSGNDEN